MNPNPKPIKVCPKLFTDWHEIVRILVKKKKDTKKSQRLTFIWTAAQPKDRHQKNQLQVNDTHHPCLHHEHLSTNIPVLFLSCTPLFPEFFLLSLFFQLRLHL